MVRVDGGTALYNGQVPRHLDLNVVRLEADLGPDAAESLAERLQAGLPHRYVETTDEAAGERLAGELGARGWSVDRILLMARAPDPPPAAAPVGEEVPYGFVRALREEWIRSEPWSGGDEDLIAQVLAADRIMFTATPTQAFAVFEQGRPLAYALLVDGGRVGMVEDVYTTPDARGRGLASAAVALALAASRGAGHAMAFLPTSATGGARVLYERLGFRPLGAVTRFARWPG